YDFIYLFFFFFQAEDGIRDFHVTGVQTCALPISILQDLWLETLTFARLAADGDAGHHRQVGVDDPVAITRWAGALRVGAEQRRRSEERRVGKEGETRWETEQ